MVHMKIIEKQDLVQEGRTSVNVDAAPHAGRRGQPVPVGFRGKG